MTKEEHIARHKELHKSLDELMADMILHTKALPAQTIVIDLMHWSYQQTLNPTEEKDE